MDNIILMLDQSLVMNLKDIKIKKAIYEEMFICVLITIIKTQLILY